MREIKAIPVIYRNVRFRSRTEAMWAAFFDAAEISWQYEPTRYDLSEADRFQDEPDRYKVLESTSYLPDFLLNGATHLEVKPDTDLLYIETLRLELLASLTDQQVFLVCGQPTPGDYQLYNFSEWSRVVCYQGESPLDDPKVFAKCRKCEGLWYYSDCGWGSINCDEDCQGESTLDLPDSIFQTAKKARFQRL